jgi:hypothetical protein
MTKSILEIKTMFGQRLVPLTLLAAVVLLVPAGLFAQGQTIAVNDFAITPPDTAVTIDVVANDTPGSGAWNPDKFSTLDNQKPSHGTVSINPDGTFLYKPDTGFSSAVPDTFGYKVCDTATPDPSCGTATVSVVVAIEVPLNIITRKLNLKKMGVIPVEIRSRGDFDVTTIDPDSLMLQGVRPVNSNMPAGKKLILKFHAQQIVSSLGPVNDRDVVVLQLTGVGAGGFAIVGEDPVIIINKGNKGKSKK